MLLCKKSDAEPVLLNMNPLYVKPDSNSQALIDFLQGRRGANDGPRHADLTLPRGSLTPGLRTMGDARVALHMDGPDRWSVEIQQGRVGPFGASACTAIYGEPDLLEAIIKGSASGVEAFLEGKLRVRGNIALSLQIEGLFATRARPKRFPRPEMVRAGDIDTFYLEAGSGPPVVLLHGLGATNASMLPPLWDLARDHRVLAPDLPGFGGSGKPMRSYDFHFFAEWLRDFLDAMGIERAVLVGNSLGGRVALEAGLSLPERVDRLVLLCPSPAFLRGRQAVPLVRLLRPELAVVPMLLTHRTVVEVARSMFSKPDRLRSEWYDSFADEFLRVFASPRGRVAFFSAARQVYLEKPSGEGGFWDRLPALKRPALFVWGEKDWLVPARFAHHIGEALPNCESIILEDCGHVPQYELPYRTNRLIRDFLETKGRGGLQVVG
jgi:pimeloyl-ACP methyl ester carboxylesterase